MIFSILTESEVSFGRHQAFKADTDWHVSPGAPIQGCGTLQCSRTSERRAAAQCSKPYQHAVEAEASD